MYAYSKVPGLVVPIPGTWGRFSIVRDLGLFDNFEQCRVPILDGLADLRPSIYGKRFATETICALAFMPVFIPLDKLSELELAGDETLKYWKFPMHGIESDTMPGFYHIPRFTRYLISRDCRIFSTQTGKFLKCHVSSAGYSSIRVTDDKDTSQVVSVHVLVATTFKGSWNVHEGMHVDHIDGNRLNNELDNLEWVSQAENNRRAKLHEYNRPTRRRVLVRNIADDTVEIHESIAAVARRFDVRPSSIFHHLNSANRFPVYKREFLIWYEGDNGGKLVDGHLESIKFSSRPRQVVAKSIETSTETTYASASEFCRATGLSRKRAFNSLTNGNQKVIDGLVFKYLDDPREWIV